MRWTPLLAFALLLDAASGIAAQEPSRVLHVSPTGQDASAGTEAAPLRTIGAALAAVRPGQRILVHAGSYAEHLVPTVSGTEAAPIELAAAPGEDVVLDGRDVELPPEEHGLVEITKLSWFRVTGFRVENAGPHPDNAGILVTDSEHVVITRNRTRDTRSSGIGVWGGRDVTVADNEIEGACGGGKQECLTIAGVDGFQVRGNHVHDGTPGRSGGEGICLKDGAARGRAHGNRVHHVRAVGIYVDAWDKPTHEIEVSGNLVHDGAGDGIALASERGGRLERIRVLNNVVWRCGTTGLTVTVNGDQPRHPMRDLRLVNNTIAVNGQGGWGGGIAVDNPGAAEVVVRNNLCSRNRSFQIVVGSDVPRRSVTIDHNLLDEFLESEGEVRGNDSVPGNPKFADAAGGDFRLRNDSPARGRGARDGAPAEDFDGKPRGADDRPPSIGAFE